ncbi:14379_t:CDS:1 [Dentiscutata heterogama]|uniref:14379_t:CDS:1 n=1 Tax=Dentiscutata heterogama TaxID=1316150 RepID=A0ACA9JUX0_9GLOM|nr:14379_t:CDS:1 [Dentiscutata heterogama]
MTTLILQNNDINVLLTADFETRVERKYMKTHDTDEDQIKELIRHNDEKFEEKLVDFILDTTEKNVEESFKELYEIVMKTKTNNEIFKKLGIALAFLLFSILLEIIFNKRYFITEIK